MIDEAKKKKKYFVFLFPMIAIFPWISGTIVSLVLLTPSFANAS